MQFFKTRHIIICDTEHPNYHRIVIKKKKQHKLVIVKLKKLLRLERSQDLPFISKVNSLTVKGCLDWNFASLPRASRYILLAFPRLSFWRFSRDSELVFYRSCPVLNDLFQTSKNRFDLRTFPALGLLAKRLEGISNQLVWPLRSSIYRIDYANFEKSHNHKNDG